MKSHMHWGQVRPGVWAALALVVVLGAGLWPLRSWQQLQQRHAALDHTLVQVQSLAAQAQQLRAASSAPSAAVRTPPAQLLQPLLAQGSTWQLQGDVGLLNLQAAPAAQWALALEQLRTQAGARVQSAQLQWQAGRVTGAVVVQLPPVQP